MKKETNTILVLIVVVLALAWIELSVGMFGTPWAGS